ncbi:MAG: hypothetical protein ACPGR8_11780 [Limisphaerales bacterium]
MTVCTVLMAAMADYIKFNPGTTVMGLRDGIREWRVNDIVYCWPQDGGKRFCIQDVSYTFYCTLQELCKRGHVVAYACKDTSVDPFCYHDISPWIRYQPLCLKHVQK